MTQTTAACLLKKAEELEQSPHLKVLLEETEKSEEKVEIVVEKPYNPHQKKLNRLKKENESFQKSLMGLSPFKYFSVHMSKSNLHMLATRFYMTFDASQIGRMTAETRLKVIEYGKEGFRKTFHKYIYDILDDHMMLHEEYEERRLEYLIENEKEAVLVTKEDLAYLEDVFTEGFEKASRLFFSLADDNKAYHSDFKREDCYTIVLEMATNILRRIPYVNRDAIKSIREAFVADLNEIETNPIFKNYGEYTVKPLSFEVVEKTEEKYVLGEHAHELLKNYATYIGTLRKLDDKDEFLLLCAGMLTALEEAGEDLESNSLERGRVSWIHFRLPEIVQMIKEVAEEQTTASH